MRFYATNDLLAIEREADDSRYALDHFFVKILGLAAGMHLPSARSEAARRQRRMELFLEELAEEIATTSE